MKPVANWRCWWRFWSTRIQLLALMVQAWMVIDPVSLLGLFNMMPRAMRELLPERLVSAVGVILFLLSLATILARNVRQAKLAERRHGGNSA